MSEDILKMLTELKGIKISTSAVEDELGFSNGLLGKAAKGKTTLSDEKYKLLKEYFESKTSAPQEEVKIPEAKKTDEIENKPIEPKKDESEPTVPKEEILKKYDTTSAQISEFDALLKMFNEITKNSTIPPSKEVADKLLDLKKLAQDSGVNYSQKRTVMGKCDNFIIGNYGLSYAKK